jgi:gag-polypeptide of LTR copia-type/Zinc knuckle
MLCAVLCATKGCCVQNKESCVQIFWGAVCNKGERFTHQFFSMSSSSAKDIFFKHGDDYVIWKLRMQGVLATKDFFGMDLTFEEWVKKNKVALKGLTREEIAEKLQNDQENALLLMYKYMDGSIIKKLGHAKWAKDAFTALDQIYLKKGGVEIVSLMYKLVNLRMRGGDVESYISEFDGVLSDLEKRGHKVVEVERALFMLCGIKEEWNYLRSQIFLQYGYDKLTTDVVRAALREQGVSVDFGKLQVKKEKQESAQEDVEAREKALFAKGVTCESCGRKGHTKAKCNTKCYECGKIGHMAANCPTKGGGDEEGSGKGKRKALFARGEISL